MVGTLPWQPHRFYCLRYVQQYVFCKDISLWPRQNEIYKMQKCEMSCRQWYFQTDTTFKISLLLFKRPTTHLWFLCVAGVHRLPSVICPILYLPNDSIRKYVILCDIHRHFVTLAILALDSLLSLKLIFIHSFHINKRNCNFFLAGWS